MYDIVTNFQILQNLKNQDTLKVNLGLIATVERTVREHLIKINSHSHIIPTIYNNFRTRQCR
jgi:hypothetical protein